MSFLNKFKLSSGFSRIFIVLALIVFVITLYFSWAQVAESKRALNEGISGITITAITNSYELIRGGKHKIIDIPPTAMPMAYGFSKYLCLSELGRTYYVDEKRVANTGLSIKEFLTITNSSIFTKCLAEKENKLSRNVYLAEFKSMITAFFSIFAVYLILLIGCSMGNWIIAGFKQ